VNIEIRNETAADVPAIETVTISAFLHAPHTGHNEQLIVSELRKAGQLTVSLVAVAAGHVVGHVAVSPVSISDGAPSWFGLGPISVVPEYQGRGVGSRLNIGDDWLRHVVVAFAALSCSGLIRLLEHFVSAGTGGVA